MHERAIHERAIHELMARASRGLAGKATRRQGPAHADRAADGGGGAKEYRK